MNFLNDKRNHVILQEFVVQLCILVKFITLALKLARMTDFKLYEVLCENFCVQFPRNKIDRPVSTILF